MLALREHVSRYDDPKQADIHIQELKIHMKHFEEAMKKIRPLSTQELDIRKYRAIWKARGQYRGQKRDF